MEAAELRAALHSFVGTERYYKHAFGRLHYTDGVKFLLDETKSYWLLDIIAIWQPHAMRDPSLREFQLWELFVKEDRSATFVCSRDPDDRAFTIPVRSTDFPLGYVKLYVEGEVLLLPSEH
jgi:hypothetical protein